MNRYMKLIACGLIASIPLSAWAASCSATACLAPISNLYIRFNFVMVELAVAETEKSEINCTLVENTYFSLLDTNPRFKEIYAALLSAQARGAEVKVRIIEGTPDCEITYVIAYT